jgi:hypothetical protein
MKTLLATGMILLASTAFAAGAPNLNGKWTVHQSIAGNDSDQECNFVQTDSKLTGTCKVNDKDVEIKGSLDGSKLTWQYDADYNGTPLTVKFTATVEDPAKINGTVDVDPFGVSGDFTATPVKTGDK